MNTTKTEHYNLGEVFAPVTMITRIVTDKMTAYFKNEAKFSPKSRRGLNFRKNNFIAILCAIYHMADRGIGKTLSSGELKISKPILDTVYNSAFADDFNYLMDLDAEFGWDMFKKRQGIRATKRTSAYGVFPNYRMKLSKIEKDTFIYERMQNFINVFMDYLKEHSDEDMPESYRAVADNYYKYGIDMEHADAICFDRHGVHFADALNFLGSIKTIGIGDSAFLKYREVEREYYMCKAFNESKYVVKEVYGRLYTPFHNLPKDYRAAFRLKSTGERVKELVDMKGAFVYGTFNVVKNMMSTIGNEAVADKIDSFLTRMDDPYQFVTCNGYDRKSIKKSVLSLLFSRPVHLRARENLLRKVNGNSFKSLEPIRSQVSGLLDFISKNKHLFYVSDKELNKVMNTIDCSDLRCFAGLNGRTSFTNNEVVGYNNFRNFVKLAERIHSAIMTDCVKRCMIDYFGEDVYDAFIKTSEILDKASVKNIKREQGMSLTYCTSKHVRPYKQVDLQDGNVINSSIICQEAEGNAMFNCVVPAIQKSTGYSNLITLHDAVFCPESLSIGMSEDALRTAMNTVFADSIKSVFMNSSLVKNAVRKYVKLEEKAA